MDIQKTFSAIAQRYDLMNRVMTLGQDRHWRRELVKGVKLQPGERLLDLGAGTGDLAVESLRLQPGCQVFAVDFTPAMLYCGRKRKEASRLIWLAADALHLPFPDESFDAVISGFLFRNVADLDQALYEQKRVLKPNGRLASLDTSRPPQNGLSPLIKIYLNKYIPLIGSLIAGNRQAYQYLSTSTQAFLSAEALAERMFRAGFIAVHFQRRMAGTIGLHWAHKPGDYG
jgi:demethylmenaquinone methyltransferase/2-methoxy-6-polyprenyl-1,4-benzoquinol methylase